MKQLHNFLQLEAEKKFSRIGTCPRLGPSEQVYMPTFHAVSRIENVSQSFSDIMYILYHNITIFCILVIFHTFFTLISLLTATLITSILPSQLWHPTLLVDFPLLPLWDPIVDGFSYRTPLSSSQRNGQNIGCIEVLATISYILHPSD